jgi:hypothetical protein
MTGYLNLDDGEESPYLPWDEMGSEHQAACDAAAARVLTRHLLPPLVVEAGPEHVCAWWVETSPGEADWHECRAVSRYLVTRSDGDPGVRAVVAVRWTPALGITGTAEAAAALLDAVKPPGGTG